MTHGILSSPKKRAASVAEQRWGHTGPRDRCNAWFELPGSQGLSPFSVDSFWISKRIVLLCEGGYLVPGALLSCFVRLLGSPGRGAVPVAAA